MKLVYRGDRDFDVIEGPITLELSYEGDGKWKLWNTCVLGDSVGGGSMWVASGAWRFWLNEHREAAEQARRAA